MEQLRLLNINLAGVSVSVVIQQERVQGLWVPWANSVQECLSVLNVVLQRVSEDRGRGRPGTSKGPAPQAQPQCAFSHWYLFAQAMSARCGERANGLRSARDATGLARQALTCPPPPLRSTLPKMDEVEWPQEPFRTKFAVSRASVRYRALCNREQPVPTLIIQVIPSPHSSG